MTGNVKVKTCFASLVCVLALLLTSCDFRLMSKQEVEKYLEKRYGREFTVLSSESVTDSYCDDDVWRVKAYTVAPKDDTGACFCVFNIVEGESFGILGFRNSLCDTYAGDVMGEAFVEQAANTELEYALNYTYPVRASSKYHSSLQITIDPVFPEDLTEVCELLSRTFTDTLNRIPGAKDRDTSASIQIRYREPDWPDEKFCSIWIEPFSRYEWNEKAGRNESVPFDISADAIRESILDETSKYKKRLYQSKA